MAMKILLAVDGSGYALDAVRFMLEHLNWATARPDVELVTVHPPVPKLPGMGKVVGRAQIEKYYAEEGAAQLAGAKKLLDAAGLKYDARVLIGPIAETLVAHARRSRCDLILIGNRGMTAAANILLGSVATKVLHLSGVPVLLVK
ncbi:MAG: universal stress protein [Betaproteobacteria bacterium]|nr:MAG: universal stress protein [Betaproteobacteria bacterium]